MTANGNMSARSQEQEPARQLEQSTSGVRALLDLPRLPHDPHALRPSWASTHPVSGRPARVVTRVNGAQRRRRAGRQGETVRDAPVLDQHALADVAQRLDALEEQFRRLATEIDPQAELIGRLEIERTTLRVRVVALEAQLFDSIGALLAGVAQCVAVVLVLAASLATLAVLALRWFSVATPLVGPIVIAAFALGTLGGACGMAWQRMR